MVSTIRAQHGDVIHCYPLLYNLSRFSRQVVYAIPMIGKKLDLLVVGRTTGPKTPFAGQCE